MESEVAVPPFKSLIALFDHFNSEKICLEYWERMRWKEGLVCPHCKGMQAYKIKGGYKCKDVICQKKFSALSGSIFENTKLPLRTWFGAIYLFTAHKKGISSMQLSRDLDIHQKSAWFVLHRIRAALKEVPVDMLNGIVEIDETWVGGKNKNRHRDKKTRYDKGEMDKMPVMGFLERDGNLRTKVISNTFLEIMREEIYCRVSQEAHIVTDNHSCYRGLHEFYEHTIVKKTDGVYKTDNHFHTNNIESYWSNFKRGIIGIYHYTSFKHLQRYSDEFAYRFNSRKITDQERFEDAISKCANTRIKYKTLIS